MTNVTTDKQLKAFLSAGALIITGSDYTLPTDDEIDTFLMSDSVRDFVQTFEFVKSKSDCSWAAWLFVALCVGKGWPVAWELLGPLPGDSGHQLVRIVNNNKKDVWIEPQTAKRVKNKRKLIVTVMP